MIRLRVFFLRALDALVRSRRDRRLDEEVQTHLDMLTDEYLARGMSPEEARLAARRAFGGIDQVKRAYREHRGLPLLDALMQDAQFAVRVLTRDRGFSTTAILVLALGIGVNNMLFIILNAHTIRGLPLDSPDRVLYVSTRDELGTDRGLSWLDFDDTRRAVRGTTLAAFSSGPASLGDPETSPERVERSYVTASTFSTLGIAPLMGRGFAAENDASGSSSVAVIGEALWKGRYRGEPGILGRTILIDGTPATVIGVVPDRSGFPGTAVLWQPLGQMPGLGQQARVVRTLRVFGRVQDRVTVEDARAEIEAVTARLASEHPDANRGVRAHVVPINERFLGRLTDPAWRAFMAVGLLVVLISCANVANLMLASALHRAREMAIRVSLGASRPRIVRQLLIESAALSAVGGGLGLAVAVAGVRAFRSMIPDHVLPYWNDYAVDQRVVAALLSVSIAAVFAFGLVPALQASKTDVNLTLKDGGPTSAASRTARRWTGAFLVAELALSVVMLSNLALGLRVAGARLPSDAALHTEEIVTAAVTLPSERYRDPSARLAFYRRLQERLAGVGAVSSISVASVLPVSSVPERRLQIQGRSEDDPAPVRVLAVEPGYFKTLGLPLSSGREFGADDGAAGQAHAIVNERLAAVFFAGVNPLGRRIAVTGSEAATNAPSWLTVVGVAPVIRQRPSAEPEAVVYVPFRAEPAVTARLMVRSSLSPEQATSMLRDEVRSLDPTLPLYSIGTLRQAVENAEWNGRVSNLLLAVLTAVAVLLTTVGLYAVTSRAVGGRAREIGIRVALGATASHVSGLVLGGVLKQLIVGVAIGCIGVMAWDVAFSPSVRAATTLPGARLADPWVIVVVGLVLAGVAMFACLVPIRRALRLNPTVALRQE